MRDPLIDLPPNCTWCGHEPHAGACPRRQTTTGTGRNTETKPCPCARNHHNQETNK